MTLVRHLSLPTRARSVVASTLSIGVAASALLICSAATGAPSDAASAITTPARPADAKPELQGDSRTLWEWIKQTGDNQGASFTIIDKKAATAHVFNGARALLGSSPVLLGLTVGDDSVPGIGEKTIADVKESERTTPAGRFIAERGRNAKGADVIWIDYDLGLSMHRVITNVPADRRLQRLDSPTSADNRISYGCVNVPIPFYESTIKPLFSTYRAVVYILPEERSIAEVFGISTEQLAALSRP